MAIFRQRNTAGMAPARPTPSHTSRSRVLAVVARLRQRLADQGRWIGFGFDIGQWLGQPLLLDLAAFGLPGCDLWIELESSLGALVFHQGSTVTHGVTLPASSSFAGTHFAAQALVLDPALAGGASLTNALLLTLW